MHITLGNFLDGRHYPCITPAGSAVVGRSILGPLSLLGLLETWLGLPQSTEAASARIAHCLKAAKHCVDSAAEAPFYADSFAIAPWPTAKRLLTMRDELMLHGWHGQVPVNTTHMRAQDPALQRLWHMAALEAQLKHMPWGLPERLQRATQALKQWGLHQTVHIDLVEPLELWPVPWQNFFATLAACCVTMQAKAFTAAATSSPNHMLAHVQASMTSTAAKPGNAVTASPGDNSLIFLEARNEREAAEALALLLPHKAQQGSTVLLRQQGGIVLEESLRRFALPRTGHAPASRWRGVLQLLPLCLRMLFGPRDVTLLHDFLHISPSPLPRKCRNRFIRALNQWAGVQNSAWQQAETEILEDLLTQAPDTAQAQWRQWQAWLLPAVAEHHVSASALTDVCDRLARWAESKHSSRLCAVLAVQARELAEAVRQCEQPYISRPLLEQMLDDMAGIGATHSFSEDEAAPWGLVEHAGQIHDAYDHGIWWDFVHNHSPLTDHWSDAEKDALEALDISLPDVNIAREREAIVWQRAFLLARQSFIFVFPSQAADDAVSPHPFWQEIVHSMNNMGQDIGLLRVHAQDIISNQQIFHHHQQPQPLAPVGLLEVPQCSPKALPQELSVTALEHLLQCPWAGAMHAHVRPAGAQNTALPELRQMMGNFAHHCVERLLAQWPLLADADPANLMQAIIHADCPGHAAPLCMPGQELLYADFIQRMQTAARGLVQRMQAQDVTTLHVEHPLTASLTAPPFTLRGRADILWTDSTGRQGIWDLKWSFSHKRYTEKMEQGQAWQLAAYATMAQCCEAAYFLLPLDKAVCSSEGGGHAYECHDIDLKDCFDAHCARLENEADRWAQGC